MSTAFWHSLGMKILITLSLFISFAHAETIKVVTTEFPPYQVIEGDFVRGIATEIVRSVVEDAGFKSEITAYPWPRAYKIAQKESNVLIYSMARTKEREKLFKWIGSIAPYNVYFWKLASRKDIKFSSIEEVKKYVVGGTNDDIKSLEMIKLGFMPGKNLELVSSDEISIRKLYAGRIEVMPYDEASFYQRVKKAGYDYSKAKKMMKFEGISNELYLAASLDTSDEVVARLQNSLAHYKKNKNFRTLQSKINKKPE